MISSFLSSVFLQVTGTIGSGIFVLPYVFFHSNFVFAVFGLVFLSIVTILINRFYANIVLATPGDHQLGGYAKIYLNHRFVKLVSLNLLLLSLGALTAYLKLFSSFLTLLFPAFTSFAPIIFLVLIIILSQKSSVIFSHYSFIISLFLVIIPFVLFIYALFFTTPISLQSWQIAPNFFFYGATMFALSGFTIVPELSRRHLHLSTSLGVVAVAIIYFISSLSIIRLSSSSPTFNSVSGIISSHYPIIILIAIFGLLATLKASLNFIHVLHEVFYRDLLFSSLASNILSLSFPFISYALISVSLISLISITGSITIFISALIICLIRLHLPQTFFTKFGIVLVLLCLFIGLVINFL